MMRDDALLLALDEPSASLDPLTELEIFRQYKAAAREAGRRHGSVTVLVSHRFSTVSMADLVVVLDKGRVVEVGSHARAHGDSAGCTPRCTNCRPATTAEPRLVESLSGRDGEI